MPSATFVTAGFDSLRDCGRAYADGPGAAGVSMRHVEDEVPTDHGHAVDRTESAGDGTAGTFADESEQELRR